MAGRFGQTHGCQPAKYGPIKFFFDHFEFKIQNKFGSFFCKKLILAKIGIVSFGLLCCNFSPNIQISKAGGWKGTGRLFTWYFRPVEL